MTRLLDHLSRKFGLRVWRQPHTARIGPPPPPIPGDTVTDTVTVTFRREVRDRVANAVWLAARQLDDDRRHAIGSRVEPYRRTR